MFHRSRGTVLFTASLLASLLSGCHQNPTAPPVSDQQVFTKIEPETAGTLVGTVYFKDINTPQQVPIDMSQDPACSLNATGRNMSEEFMIHNGDLQNVFVFIKTGLGSRVYAPDTTPVVLDQKGCHYVPHVIAVSVGQPIEVHNSDMTMHNVHPEPIAIGNHESDITQAPHGKPVDVAFQQPETMMAVRCNNHPWMEAFINVADNPFYAITDASGHYEIHGLPPGTYTLGAAHEKLGRKEMTITIQPHATTTADFTFQAR